MEIFVNDLDRIVVQSDNLVFVGIHERQQRPATHELTSIFYIVGWD